MKPLTCPCCSGKFTTLASLQNPKHTCGRGCERCGGWFSTNKIHREHDCGATRVWVRARLKEEARKATLIQIRPKKM